MTLASVILDILDSFVLMIIKHIIIYEDIISFTKAYNIIVTSAM